jgi:amino acid adenylation domain-containing protein/FkbM family methyltransferase
MSAVQEEIVEGFSLSPQQRHLWSLQYTSDTQPYGAQCAILIEGVLYRKKLDLAWRRLVKRHEILRTTFQNLPEMTLPVQVVTDDLVNIEQTHDLSDLHPENQQLAIEGIDQKLRRQRFDLQHSPPLRLSLVKLSAERHLLFVSTSALCADAFTLRKLAGELGRLYTDHDVPADPAQYADLAEWQNQVLEEEAATAGREFWREQRSLFTNKLPFEKRTYAQTEFAPQVFSASVESQLWSGLIELAHKQQTSLPTLLLTCWHVLIGRLTTQQDVVIAASFDGRNHEELEDVFGPFEKYLPVRASITENKGFLTLLREICEVLKTATNFQQSFSPEILDHSSDEARLFKTLSFAFEPPPERYSTGSISFSIASTYTCTDRFKLKLCCLEDRQKLTTEFHYDPEQLSRETVHAVGDYYRRLLESVTENPDARIHELEILTSLQRERLFALNHTKTTLPAVECIQELFAVQVNRYPQETAVVFEEQQLTYKELDHEANQLAHHLRRLGVGPEVRVGFCLERSAAMIVAMLGILKSGGAYVPLESNQPASRLIDQLREAGARLVLTQKSRLDLWSEVDGTVLCIDRDGLTWSNYPEENPSVVNVADDLAYVLFTSGSTGTPKAVGVLHRSLINYAGNICRKIAAPESGRMNFAMVTPISADLCMTALYGALISGGCLHIVNYDRATSGAAMAAYMRTHEIDVLKIVPSHLSALLAAGGADVIPRRYLFVGGEALSSELAHRIRSLRPDCELINHYGPTEATVGSLTNTVAENYETTVPIGWPLGNTQAYILDRCLHLTPPGVAGELYLGGMGLARGYLNDASRTAERFVPHPFARVPGERLYRTGDLARYVADGSIEFIGRVDHQVKLSGYRIEPGEIEATLKQHEGVREAFVMLREDAPGQKRLVAYVVPEQAQAPLLAGRERYRLPNEMAIAQQNQYETDFFYKQIFIDQTTTKYVRLPPGACVFDVGANIGLFTLFVSQVYDNAKIYAFEPVPPVFSLLQANAALYGNNVSLYNCGLANESKTVTFTYYPHLSCMSGYYADEQADRETLSLILQHQQEERPELASLTSYIDQLADDRTRSETFACRLTTISDVIRENGIDRIDLLKIDVEKSELDVLEGIADQDWNKIGNIVIEAHDVDDQLQRLTTLLKNRGHHVHVEEDASLRQTGLFNVYASLDPFVPGTDIRISNDRLTAQNNRPLSITELNAYLKERLPSYMIPSAIVMLEALPLTANGKVDRPALPVPEKLRGCEYVAPRDDVETIIAGVWGRVLGVERVGIYDDYFAIGGDSIRVIQIVHELNQYGLRLTALDVINRRTVSKLAQQAREAKTQESVGPPVLKLPRLEKDLLGEGIEDAYPAAQMQEYVSYHYAHDRQGLGAYHIQQSFHVYDDDLSIAAFKQAIDILVSRHPVLRTTFRVEPEVGTLQLLHTQLPVVIREEHLEHLDQTEQEKYVSAALIRDRAEPFDVTSQKQTPFRVTIFHRAQQSAEFLFSFHHAIMDGWGNQVLMSELVQLYTALKRGQVVPQRPVINTYKEFVALEQEITGSREAALFWQRHLTNHHPHELPRAVSNAGPADEINYVEELDHELAVHLQRTSRAQSVSLKSILLNSYLELIGGITGADPVTVGVVSNGRSERLSEPLQALGLFWNIIPFCCAVVESDHVSRIRRVQQLLIDTELYARYPLPQILRDRQQDALFWATFNFIHFPEPDVDTASGLRLLNERVHDKFHFPLNYVVSLDSASENITLRVEYDKSYFDADHIRTLTRDYINLLAR